MMGGGGVDEESLLLATEHDERQNENDTWPSWDEGPSFSRTLSNPWESYTMSLEKRPVLVKSITAFFIMGGADLCGQSMEHLRGTATYAAVDWPRAARFSAFGLCGAPWAHYYFYYLDHYFPPTPEPFTRTTWIKLLIDQGVQAPLLLLFMISALSIMKGEGWTGVEHDLSTMYIPTLIANWKLWIPASLINLAFVKPSLRVLYVNVVFFVWTIILSIMLNSS